MKSAISTAVLGLVFLGCSGSDPADVADGNGLAGASGVSTGGTFGGTGGSATGSGGTISGTGGTAAGGTFGTGGTGTGGSHGGACPVVTPWVCDAGSTSGGVCAKNVGPIRVNFCPGVEAPTRFSMYLHGDGGNELSTEVSGMCAWAAEHDIFLIAPKAPFADGTGPRWWLKQPETVVALEMVLNDVFDSYCLPTDNTLIFGASGGSIFMTQNYLERFGGKYQGLLLQFCGGSYPEDVLTPGTPPNWTWDYAKDKATRDKFTLVYRYGSNDFLKTGIEGSSAHFSSVGFSTVNLISQGVGHCVPVASEYQGYMATYGHVE